MKDWITVKELAQIQGITPRAVRKSIANDKYVAREANAKNGTKYEILVSSLDYHTQNLIDFEKFKNKNEKSAEPSLRKNDVIPEHAKKIALIRYDLVRLWVDYRNKAKSKTEAGKDFILLYNEKKLHAKIFKTLGNVSIGTIYRWAKAIKKSNDYLDLVPDYKYGEQEHNVNITKQEELVFKGLLLSPNKITVAKAASFTKYLLKSKGIESPTSKRSLERWAKLYKKKHYDTWILAREGHKVLRDKVEPYITRDASKLGVGDVLIADGHRLAVQVINPYTGRPCRATLVGYQDWKSTALIGYEIMLEENTQCVASALRNSIINLGKIPKICYQDNGKAFKNKFFKGSLEESGINGLFANLGIVPVFASPYNARAKTIERFFKEFQESFERLLPSFVGSSIADKPAYMMRNEKFHKKHHNEFIPTIEQLNQMIAMWFDYHYSQPCPNVKGKTIGEVLELGKGDGVDVALLDDLMLAQDIKRIHRNGIRFLKADYYNELLYGLRERVLIKYSLFDLSHIKVFDTNGKFLCDAKREMPLHPMANYLGKPKDVEDLKQKLKQQKQLTQQTEKKLEKTLNLQETPQLEWNKPPVTKIYKLKKMDGTECSDAEIFEHRYERYEHLQKKNILSDEDKNWIEKYKQTQEYKEIYGEEEIC